MENYQFQKEVSLVYKNKYRQILHFFKGKYPGHQIDIDTLEDIISEGFSRAIEKYGQYNPDMASISTWVTRIIDNLIKDKFKKRQLETVSEDALLQDHTAPEDYYFKKCLFNLFIRQVEKQSPAQRNALILSFIFGLDDSSISGMLGCDVNSVRANKSRGLANIMENLGSKGFVLGNSLATMKDLQITREEVSSIITDPKTCGIFIDYFFDLNHISDILENYKLSEEEFYEHILSGLEDIALAGLERKEKKEALQPDENALQNACLALFREITAVDIVNAVHGKK